MPEVRENTGRKEEGLFAGWWRVLPMTNRFFLRMAAIAIPVATLAGLLLVRILVEDRTPGKWLVGAGIGLGAGVLAVAIAGYSFMVTYVRPLEMLEEFARRLMSRDFAAEVDISAAGSELGPISIALTEMLGSLRGLADEMQGVAEDVAGSSNLMASLSRETSDAFQDTSTTISALAQGADEQVQSMMLASSTINKMAEEIERVNEAAREVAKYSSEAGITVEEGVDSVNRATEKMGLLVEATGTTAGAMRELGEKSEQIGLIVDVITDMADQTNLLALNAAIEAARAGEHGRGFAVVAGEVRKLAEGSARAANQIAAIIREIQRTINATVVSMERNANEADEGAVMVNETGKSLYRIKEAVGTIGIETQEISQATDGINDGANKVVEVIGNVASISEESASSTQEVSATIQEQTASMQEISSAAAELAETAERLRSMIVGIDTG
jgi:methyl-accepting chemotaxis protein